MKSIIQDIAILVISAALIIILMACSHYAGMQEALKEFNDEKTALEIQILRRELKAYEEMDKELKSE